MNKNPEKFAIEYLIRNGYKLQEMCNNFAKQVINITIEALEKQIPRQVGDIIGDYENDYDCPICGTITRFEHQRHCIECGQKLKW